MARKAAAPKTLDDLLAGIPPLEDLRITLTVMIFNGGRPAIRLSTKSVTDYKRRAKSLCPVIVADPKQTHADMLRMIADTLDRVATRKQTGACDG